MTTKIGMSCRVLCRIGCSKTSIATSQQHGVTFQITVNLMLPYVPTFSFVGHTHTHTHTELRNLKSVKT